MLVMVGVCLLMASFKFEGRGDQLSQEDVKIAYLFKFTNYFGWPDYSLEDSSFKIAVFGESSLTSKMRSYFSGRTVHNIPVKIIEIDSAELTKANMKMLIVPEEERGKLDKLRDALSGQPVLLVGESEGMARSGAHVNFYLTDKGTLHFAVNPGEIVNSGLEVDMRFLEYAKIIEK